MSRLGTTEGSGDYTFVSVHAAEVKAMPMPKKNGAQRVFSYKSVPWSTWPRAFSNPFAADNASYSSQPQGQERQPHESLAF